MQIIWFFIHPKIPTTRVVALSPFFINICINFRQISHLDIKLYKQLLTIERGDLFWIIIKESGILKKLMTRLLKSILNQVANGHSIFSFDLALIAIIGFFIYGETSCEMDNTGALYIGLGIGTMFILIALIQNRSRKKSKTWDGVGVDKKIEKKKRRNPILMMGVIIGKSMTSILLPLKVMQVRSIQSLLKTMIPSIIIIILATR